MYNLIKSIVAKSIIHIGKQIYRKLNKEKQYLFTEIQNHEIWSNQSFWIEYFYEQHQKRLVRHYKTKNGESFEDFDGNSEILKTAADQLAMWEAKSDSKKVEIGDEEEGIVYTHIIDLGKVQNKSLVLVLFRQFLKPTKVYEIIPLLVPFEANLSQLKKHMRSNQVSDGSSVLTGTTYEEDEDEGFDESGGVVSIVHKFMEKIQDRLVIDCRIRKEVMLVETVSNIYSNAFGKSLFAYKRRQLCP